VMYMYSMISLQQFTYSMAEVYEWGCSQLLTIC